MKKKIELYLISNTFENVIEGNEDIAQEFSGFHVIGQGHFDESQIIRESGKDAPHHIAGSALKEEVITEIIKRMQKEIKDKALDSKQILDELIEKEFTYEWLDKHDPKNFTLGLYCDCCASIVSTFYGKDIMKASIVRDDVQNLVIRNNNGEIIAKATIYVNKEKGYAVFNDIEMKRDYGNEVNQDEETNDIQRDKIYKAFKRGVKAFVERYNEVYPDKPITQVNIGWGYNRLKQIIKKYESESDVILETIGSFHDAKNEQWIIYKK